jgi:hydrogenase-4 component B
MNYFNFNYFISIDPISLFFIFVILLVSIPSAMFSVSYLKEYPKNKIVRAWILFFIFIASMLAVVAAANALLFLIVWELMSLVSYFLVVFDTEDERSVKAGIIYLVMTHLGTAFITIAILMIHKYSNSFSFTDFSQGCALIPAVQKNIIFLCFLIGFGTKAGIVPLHIWLPYAHPQAPSHISSLMSGVMIKTAIYGLIRFVIMMLGVQNLWWGNLILVLAAVSCLVGVMYALTENDIKKLLAYSSVENIGIILLGIGTSMVFIKLNKPVLAVFALSAGLFHLLNHAVFKSLLFLCSGSVYKATGIRNMEQLGGLAKKMKWTSFSFLIGSMAISALPPLNGFVSEWLTLQALFMGVIAGSGKVKVFMGLLGAVLALTGGLAAACFVKAFGITFLALPRSKQAEEAKESPLLMIIPMIGLSITAILFGVLAVPVFKKLIFISGATLSVNTSAFNFVSGNLITLAGVWNNTNLNIPLIAISLLVVAGFAFFALILFYGRRKATTYKTWDCGYYALNERNEYTATAFSKPFRIAFDFFYRPYRKTEEIKESQYYVKSMKYETAITPVFKKYIYRKVVNRILNIANMIARLQSGSIHLYIGYVFITVLILLIFFN